MDELIQKLEEKVIDLVERMDAGEEKALEELKSLKKAIDNLDGFMSFLDENDTLESIGKKMDFLEKRFDEFLMELNKVVG